MEHQLSDVLSEFAQNLVTDFSIQAILDHLVVRIVDILPITGAGVTLMRDSAEPKYVAASDVAALGYERIQSELSDGPCVVAYETGLAVSVPDLRVDHRFPAFARRSLDAGLVAVFTFPLRQGDEQLGALDLYRTTAGPLDDSDMATAQTLANVAASYLSIAQARFDLEQSLEQVRQSALRDIEAERALRSSEERTSAILASAPDAVVTVDDSCRVVGFNPAAERTFGYAKVDAIGLDLAALVAAPSTLDGTWVDADGHLSAAAKLLIGRRTELTASCSDGSTFPSEVSVSEVQGESSPLYTCFVRDLRERAAADAARRALEDQLHQSERLDSLGQLAGGVAHDFNNLLTVILNYASFIVEAPTRDATIASYANAIVSAAQRAAGLTNQLLLFARREPVQRTSFSIDAIVADLEEMLQRIIGENVTLSVQLGAEHSLVHGDRGQMEQMLTNLAVNARDAMPRGGTITITTTVMPTGAARQVELTVADTGTGMSAEVAARAFDPFFTTKPRGEGSGLGLATVYGIVADAAGTIEVQSTVGVGTTITVRFPVDDAAVLTEPELRPPPSGHGGGEHVLVAEDEDAVRTVVVAMLRRNGYEVSEAANADEAISAATTKRIDLLLTDVAMPQTSGPELAVALAGLDLRNAVLYMTGCTGGAFDALDTPDPAGELIRKPFTEIELLAAVRRSLDETDRSVAS